MDVGSGVRVGEGVAVSGREVGVIDGASGEGTAGGGEERAAAAAGDAVGTAARVMTGEGVSLAVGGGFVSVGGAVGDGEGGSSGFVSPSVSIRSEARIYSGSFICVLITIPFVCVWKALPCVPWRLIMLAK